MVFTGENGLGPVITALEKVLPGDITGLGDRKNRYSLLLNEEGGILDDLMVTKRIWMAPRNSTWSSTARPNMTTSPICLISSLMMRR